MELLIAREEEFRRNTITLHPIIARHCSLPPTIISRSPIDFTHSYHEGLSLLITNISTPKSIFPIDDTLKDIFPTDDTLKDTALEPSQRIIRDLRKQIVHNPEKLYDLRPQQFESMVVSLFEDMFDYQVEISAKAADKGYAFVVPKARGLKIPTTLIQCKHYALSKSVGPKTIESLITDMKKSGFDHAILVTTAHFTREAQRLASTGGDRWQVDLVDHNELLSWITRFRRYGPAGIISLTQMRRRYGELIDKSFAAPLSLFEEEELHWLTCSLDDAEAEFYEPLKKTLKEHRDKLIRNQSKNNRGKE